jgi:hypothetical protein
MSTSLSEWFKGWNNGPHEFHHFDLNGIPKYSVQELAQHISSNPQQVQCALVRIHELQSVFQTVYSTIKRDYQVDDYYVRRSCEVHLKAVCPKCLGSIGGEGFFRIAGEHNRMAAERCSTSAEVLSLNRAKPNCDSESYYAVWMGDKTATAGKGMKTEILDPKDGAVFLMPIDSEPRLYGACRVIRRGDPSRRHPNDRLWITETGLLVAATTWVGTGIPDLSEPKLKIVLKKTFGNWNGSLEIQWIRDNLFAPCDFSLLGVIPTSLEEHQLGSNESGSWYSLANQVLLQWQPVVIVEPWSD